MAGWLSSKLKEAEQFLQQIDQQAAESLGKPEKQKPGGTLEGRHGLHGNINHLSDISYKNQKNVLSKTAPRAKLELGSEPTSSALSKLIKKSDQGPNALNGNARSDIKDSSSYKKHHVASILQVAEDPEGNVGRDDWTELLASPSVDLVASPALASSVGSSDSGRAGYLKAPSSRFTSNSNKNGGRRRQSDDLFSGNLSLANPNTKDSTMTSKISASFSKIGSIDSSNVALPGSFGDETHPRRLELDLAGLVGAEAGGLIKGPTSNSTGSNENGVDLSQAMTRRLSDSEDSMHVSEGLIEEFAKEDSADERKSSEKQMEGPSKMWKQVGRSSGPASECMDHFAELDQSMVLPIDNHYDNTRRVSQTILQEESGRPFEDVERVEEVEMLTRSTQNLIGENGTLSDSHPTAEGRELSVAYDVGQLETLLGTQALPVSLQSDEESYESSSMSDADSDRETESEEEKEIERQKSAHKKRIARRKELTAVRAAAAQAAIRERELFVEKLEKDVITLKRVLAEREEQQGREAAELRMSIGEVMHALETEKKLHSSTRMKALAVESQLENQNADLAKSLGALQWELEEQMSKVLKARRAIEDKEAFKADLERRLSKIRRDTCSRQQNGEPKFVDKVKDEDCSFEDEQSDLWKKIQQCQIQVKDLEVKIRSLKDTQHVPTETEKELEDHLAQLTDHLIQKQAQVEALSTEKATLMIRLEALSKRIDEERAMVSSQGLRNKLGGRRSLDWDSKYYDMEYGLGRSYDSKVKPFAHELGESSATVGSMGSVPLSPVLRQLNGFFSAGMFYLRMHRWAQAFAVVYIIILHLWVWFVVSMNSKPTQTLALQEFGLPKDVSELKDGSNVTNLL